MKLSLPSAKLPTKAHPFDAAFDLYSPKDFTLGGGKTITVNTGVHFGIPQGWYGQVAGRSSLGKNGITVFGGVVDSGYTGPIHVVLANIGDDHDFKQGDRIAQILFLPVLEATFRLVEDLDSTSRGDNGFGSSGR